MDTAVTIIANPAQALSASCLSTLPHTSEKDEHISEKIMVCADRNLTEKSAVEPTENTGNNAFAALGLQKELLKVLEELGYEQPSPIQKGCIPPLLDGQDVLGLAQTGSGKTAAFALPALQRINPKQNQVQLLVLTPTRELAIQVAQNCAVYAKYFRNIRVCALYGGQRYEVQLRELKNFPQIVVATPGRLMDLMNQQAVTFQGLKFLVLDEADEMLRMGFLEAVETILTQLPKNRQTALFSATMPEAIRKITTNFLTKPQEIRIQSKARTGPQIEQTYWVVRGLDKEQALLRFLETETFESAIIFVKTKSGTLSVAEAIEKSGYRAAALNGDMSQSAREQTLQQLKSGKLEVLVATDVAARGLDVDRISWVINYDVPMDTETYVHRIGRTGRAGRTGKALLFVHPREFRMLRQIELVTKSQINAVNLPDVRQLQQKRFEKLALTLKPLLQDSSLLETCSGFVAKLSEALEIDVGSLSAALLHLVQKPMPLIVPEASVSFRPSGTQRLGIRKSASGFESSGSRNREEAMSSSRQNSNFNKSDGQRSIRKRPMVAYRADIRHAQGIEVRHLVGALINEGQLTGQQIGSIKLHDGYARIELCRALTEVQLNQVKKIRLFNRSLDLRIEA